MSRIQKDFIEYIFKDYILKGFSVESLRSRKSRIKNIFEFYSQEELNEFQHELMVHSHLLCKENYTQSVAKRWCNFWLDLLPVDGTPICRKVLESICLYKEDPAKKEKILLSNFSQELRGIACFILDGRNWYDEDEFENYFKD